MSFAAALARVAYYEGFSNGRTGHTHDSGGDTWYGISHDAHPEIVPWPPSDAQVSQFYKSEWDESGAQHVPEPADTAYFLAYINMGPKRAIQCLQRALRANGRSTVDDGEFGPNTLRQMAFADGTMLMTALRSEIAGYYRRLVVENYSLGEYLAGWLKRAYEETL